jgi:Fic family protein
MPPPAVDQIISAMPSSRLVSFVAASRASRDDYLHWDDLRYKSPPEGLSSEEWWALLKIGRIAQQRITPLLDKRSTPFTYSLPDRALKLLHAIDRDAFGQISLSEEITGSANRDRYIKGSLIEEAITSSQLEGASTTRRVAKDMITSGRAPRDKSERMILNNYFAMERVRELRDEPLSRALLEEIHRIVTKDTMRSPELEGAIQTSADVRVAVHAIDDSRQVLHDPPGAEQLPERIERMCEFANGTLDDDGDFMHPVIRAIILHFWIGYDHPFEDGNGRTARAIFYWSMLHSESWLAEYLTISKILKAAPTKYARAYLLSETDDNDLTYFILFHLDVIRRAIDELHAFLQRKLSELRKTRLLIRQDQDLNHRQVELLRDALRKPGAIYTIRGHMGSHGVVYQTARTDLLSLAERGWLRRAKQGRAFVFIAPEDLAERLEAGIPTT